MSEGSGWSASRRSLAKRFRIFQRGLFGVYTSSERGARPLARHYSRSLTTLQLRELYSQSCPSLYRETRAELAPRHVMRFNKPFRVLISYLQRDVVIQDSVEGFKYSCQAVSRFHQLIHVNCTAARWQTLSCQDHDNIYGTICGMVSFN